MFTAEARTANRRPTFAELSLDETLVSEWQAAQVSAQSAQADLKQLRADIQRQNVVVEELQQQGAAEFFIERDKLRDLKREEFILQLDWLRMCQAAELAHVKVYEPFCNSAVRAELVEAERQKKALIAAAEAEYEAQQAQLDFAAAYAGDYRRNAEALRKQIADLQKQMANVD